MNNQRDFPACFRFPEEVNFATFYRFYLRGLLFLEPELDTTLAGSCRTVLKKNHQDLNALSQYIWIREGSGKLVTRVLLAGVGHYQLAPLSGQQITTVLRSLQFSDFYEVFGLITSGLLLIFVYGSLLSITLR